MLFSKACWCRGMLNNYKIHFYRGVFQEMSLYLRASIVKSILSMNTITIDNKLYKEAMQYADNKRMSISGLFELAVRKFMEHNPVRTKESVLDSAEYKRALDYMDELMAGEQIVSVPSDEDGRGARTEKYMR